MLDPVSRGIYSKRKVVDSRLVHLVVQRKEDAQGSLGDNRVRRQRKNVVPREVLPRIGKAFRCQVFFDREMGELYYSLPVDIDNGDLTRACGQHRLFWILNAPIRIVAGKGSLAKLNREDICKLLDTK